MNAMSPVKSAALAGLVASMTLAAPVHASSLSYYLDQSNVLADGINYLQVQVADGANGAVDFTVQVLGPLTSIAGSNFGIQSFGFNVAPGGDAEALNVTGLADGWKATNNRRMSEFGFFDIQLQATGNARLQTLSFSITGVDGDSAADYVIFSTGNSAGGQQFFAAHVAGFEYCDDAGGSGSGGGCGDSGSSLQSFAVQSAGGQQGQSGRKGHNGHESWSSHAWQHDWQNEMDHHWDGNWVEDCITSGFFAGSTAVPLPGTAWLFLAGAAGVMARARRRQRA